MNETLTFMPRTATRTALPETEARAARRENLQEPERRNNQTETEEVEEDNEDDSETKSRNTSPYMRALRSEWIYEPGPLDFIDMDSREFVLEIISRRILKNLQLKTLEDWLQLAEDAWDWSESEELRRKQAKVKAFFASIADDKVMLGLTKQEAALIDVAAIEV